MRHLPERRGRSCISRGASRVGVLESRELVLAILNRPPTEAQEGPPEAWTVQIHGVRGCMHIPTHTLFAGSSPRNLLAVPAVSAFPVPVPFLRFGDRRRQQKGGLCDAARKHRQAPGGNQGLLEPSRRWYSRPPTPAGASVFVSACADDLGFCNTAHAFTAVTI